MKFWPDRFRRDGEAYRARHPMSKREVAISVLRASVLQDSDRLRRFELEAQAAAALNHPNILAVYQFGTFKGAPYLSPTITGGRYPANRCCHAARFQFARQSTTVFRSPTD